MQSFKAPRPFAPLSLALLLSCAPAAFDLTGPDLLHETSAVAKEGRSGGDSDSGGGRGGGGSSDDGNDSSGSGSGRGSSDDEGDSSGRSGGGSDDGDDSSGSGSGRGGRDSSDDGRGNDDDDDSSGRRGGSDDDRDERGASGRHGGRDDHGGRRDREDDRPRQAVSVAGSAVTKFEREGSDIEVTTRDGFRQEIEGGRYELKDPSGRTIVERPATAEDRERLLNLGN